MLGQFCLLKHVLDKDVHSLHVVTVPMQLTVIHLYIGHFQLSGGPSFVSCQDGNIPKAPKPKHVFLEGLESQCHGLIDS